MYEFTPTQDWFSHNIESWKALFPLVATDKPRILEIGSWEGRSAVFLLTELCKDGGEIVCIDHFDLFRTSAGRDRFGRINRNLAATGKESYRVLPKFSVPALMQLLEEEIGAAHPGFDWIYVDGSHEADDTFLDGELVWRLAKEGAVVIFDDYHWDKEPEDSIHHPRRGVDAFLALHADQYELLTAPQHYQVVLKKKTPMRIGFLVDSMARKNVESEEDVLGHGVHVALTVDSQFAIGAAVAIRSAADCTPGRLTFYIVDCGLSNADRDHLSQSLPGRKDITLKLIELPEDNLAKQRGSTWAKVDMFNILPVERVLYLDADVLVRHSLRELWKTDMSGHPLGAVVDVGHPMGHDDIKQGPYFNAGVLLLDLALIRESLQELRSISRVGRA